MNFIQKALRWIEYGDYTPVIKYGVVYSRKIGREQFSLAPELLQGQKDWILRLDLNQRYGGNHNRTIIDCHFRALSEISRPIRQLLDDVRTGVTQPNDTVKTGTIDKWLLSFTTGQILRSYGRIDHDPRREGRFRIELFLSWDGQQYWLLLKEWEGSGEWSHWPIGLVEELHHLFPEIEDTITERSVSAT